MFSWGDASKTQIIWKARRGHMGWFMLIFAIFEGLSVGYAVLADYILNKYAPVPPVRNSFSFGDLLVGLISLVVMYVCWDGIKAQEARHRQVNAVVAKIETVINAFGSLETAALTKATPFQFMGITYSITGTMLISEILNAIILASVALVWELSYFEGYTPPIAEIKEMIESTFDPNNIGYKSPMTKIFNEMYTSETTTMPWCVLLLQGAQGRISILQGAGYAPFAIVRTNQLMTDIMTDASTLIKDREVKQWWWVSIAYYFIAVILLLLAPFAMWQSQGDDILFYYPLLFLLVGGLLALRIQLSDVFVYPTSLHALKVYSSINSLANKADAKLKMFTHDNRYKIVNIVTKYLTPKPRSPND